MKMITRSLFTALTLSMIVAGSCGGDDEKGGSSSTGSTGNNNTLAALAGGGSSSGGSSMGGSCPSSSSSGSSTCSNADIEPYTNCIITKCDAQYKAALGDEYKAGKFGGACGTYLTCTQACKCGDTACTTACTQSPECRMAFLNIGTCAFGAACTLPACATSGATTGGGKLDAGVTLPTGGCAALTACCARLSGTQKTQCEMMLNQVKVGGDLACNVSLAAYMASGLCK
jgi:hypothetical protein